MPVVIIRKRNGIDFKEIDEGDWHTMVTALEWKETGNWGTIKNYVYKNGLNKKKSRWSR